MWNPSWRFCGRNGEHPAVEQLRYVESTFFLSPYSIAGSFYVGWKYLERRHSFLCLRVLASFFKLNFGKLLGLRYNNVVLLDPNFIPTTETFLLLNRTPCFVPTPTRCDHSFVWSQVVDFARKLRWAHALPAPSTKPRFGLLPSNRWPPRSLVPSDVLRLTTRLICRSRTLLRSHRCCSYPNNLTADFQAEITSLQHSGFVISINTFDKGSKWTVLSPALYVEAIGF